MEFKELLAYAKRSWLVILVISATLGVAAYFAVDYFPNRDTSRKYSSSGEFDTPIDSFRISGSGSTDARRIMIDSNTEVASVSSQGNRETAARYFVVLEQLGESLRKGLPAPAEGEEPARVTNEPGYDQALKQLAARAEYIFEGGSAAGEYYRVEVGGAAFDLSTVASAAPHREAQVRVNGGPVAGVQVTVAPRTSSRRVMVQVDNAPSADAARMWLDSVLLAAKRESFQRLLGQFDALIRRSEMELQREIRPVAQARVELLEAAAAARFASLREQAERVRAQHLSGINAGETAAAPETESVFVEEPQFDPDNVNAEKRVYYGFIRREIENKFPAIASTVEMRSPLGLYEQQQLASWRTELSEQQRRARNAETGLRVRLVATETALKAEEERFGQYRNEKRLLEYIPNLAIVNSPEMSKTRSELDSALRDRSDKEQRLKPEHYDMIDAVRRAGLALTNWESALVQGFALAHEKIRIERASLTAEAEAARAGCVSLVAEIARLQEAYAFAVSCGVAYTRAVNVTEEMRGAERTLESNLSAIRRQRNNQVPVIQVSSFSVRATAGSAGAMGKLNIAAIVFVMSLVGCAVTIYVWALSRNRITNEFDVRKHINLPVLAKFSERAMDQVSLLDVNPKSGVAEAFSTLATLVRSYAKELSLRSLLVTSAIMEEGKTDISSNLGIALSRKGLRVLVVDADLHRSRVGNFFGERKGGSSRGLLGWVADGGKGELGNYASSIPDGPDVLLPGGTVEDPVKVLESDAFKSLMKQAEREYDFVIYDSPPVTRVGDALILAGEIDATILVCSCGDVSFADAAMAKRLLTGVQANLLGVVLNNSKDAEAREYYNYYSYGKESRRRVRRVVD